MPLVLLEPISLNLLDVLVALALLQCVNNKLGRGEQPLLVQSLRKDLYCG